MRVRSDGRYWVIAESADWYEDGTNGYIAKIYYGKFPIRTKEVGFLEWGETIASAIEKAIWKFERYMQAQGAQHRRSIENEALGYRNEQNNIDNKIYRKFTDEWRL